MKVLLIKTDGSTKKIKINNLDDVRSIIHDSDCDREIKEHILIDDRIILAQENNKNFFSEINQYATELAIEMLALTPNSYITGDVILIEDVDEFDLIRGD